MINPELVSYIKLAKEKGVPLETIKSNLLGTGWTDADISQAFGSLDAPASTPASAPTPNPAPVFTQEPHFSPDSASSNNFVNPGVATVAHHKSHALLYSIIITIIILGGGGVIFAFTQNIGPFTKPARYNESNLMSGLLDQSSKINTSAYSISGSLKVEPRDADAKPFTLSPLGDEFLKKYKNDVTRSKDLAAIISSLRYRYAGYTTTLEQLKSGAGSFIGGSMSLVDPVTNKEYAYALTDGGKNFRLTATFETDEAISQIRSSYGFKAETTQISGKTVAFTKDSSSYFYLSSEPPKPFFATLGEEAKYLPAEFSADVAFSVKADWQTKDLADWAVNIDANGDFGDLSYKVNIDALKKEADYYLKINNIPSIIMGSFSDLKGQWIKITPKKKNDSSASPYVGYDPLSSLADSFSREESSYRENRAESMELLKKAAKFADEEKLFSFKTNPVKEKVGDRELYRYDLKVNKDAILPFYKKLVAEAQQTKNFKNVFEDSGLLAYLETPEFNNVFEYYQANNSLSISVDKDGFPAIIKYTFRLVPPDSADQLKTKQAKLVLSLNISDVNKPVNIQAPADAKNIEDLPAFKTARNKGTNASIKANLSNMRASAELYYDKSSSYGAASSSCEATPGTLFSDTYMSGSIASIKKSVQDGGTTSSGVNCYSSKTAWAASAKLADDTDKNEAYWCVDSSGSSKAVTKPASGTVCPK